MISCSEMKDSGVEWIKNIPKHWEIRKIKYLVKDPLLYGANETGEYENSNGIRYIRITDISKDGNLKTDNILYLDRDKGINYLLQDGDLLLARSGATVGKSFLYKKKYGEACFAGYLIRCRVDKSKLLPEFFYYYTKSKPYWDYISLATIQATIQNVNGTKYNNLLIYLPEIDEQRIIIEHLHLKNTQIDNQINLTNKLIRLLKEKRQTIIDQTVTKGLDLNVPTKESGIKWIGNIPEHWKINKIKFTSYVKGRIGWQGLRSDEFTEVGPYLITGTEFKDGKIDWEECYHVETWRFEQDPYIQIKNDDILLTKDGTIGKVAFIEDIPGHTTLNSGVMVIRPLHNLYLPKFMYWILKSEQFTQYVEYTKTGSTISHLYQETFENLTFSYPDYIKEQEKIVEYLDKEIQKINNIISRNLNLINLYEEKRKAIISSAISGQIDINCIQRRQKL